jgi:oligopeptide/dipeptide ABC transporter ATP-binding protein
VDAENGTRVDAEYSEPLLIVERVSKTFRGRKAFFGQNTELVRAVDDVSLVINRGEAFGIVGESGCGKSTFARLILRLIEPSSGRVIFDGTPITNLPKEEMRRLRRRIQVVFQDPYSTLDPRMSIHDAVEEPLVIHNIGDRDERQKRVYEMLGLVGIAKAQASRKPHEFSGGQRQRVAIARALVIEPDLVVLDEPVSALDVSIQAQVLNLLKDLQKRLRLTYVFIVHDLAVAEHFCDRVAVLYLGAIMEMAETQALFANTQHPYSRALISAVPIPDPTIERNRTRIVLTGEVGSTESRQGCRFEPRCPVGRGRDVCRLEEPPLREAERGRWVACHFAGEAPRETAVRRESALTGPNTVHSNKENESASQG